MENIVTYEGEELFRFGANREITMTSEVSRERLAQIILELQWILEVERETHRATLRLYD